MECWLNGNTIRTWNGLEIDANDLERNMHANKNFHMVKIKTFKTYFLLKFTKIYAVTIYCSMVFTHSHKVLVRYDPERGRRVKG